MLSFLPLPIGLYFRPEGNPVEIRNCPAAVSRNDRRIEHWALVNALGKHGQ
jgi:hypothetical protein